LCPDSKAQLTKPAQANSPLNLKAPQPLKQLAPDEGVYTYNIYSHSDYGIRALLAAGAEGHVGNGQERLRQIR
jgi:hypothetical protein